MSNALCPIVVHVVDIVDTVVAASLRVHAVHTETHTRHTMYVSVQRTLPSHTTPPQIRIERGRERETDGGNDERPLHRDCGSECTAIIVVVVVIIIIVVVVVAL